MRRPVARPPPPAKPGRGQGGNEEEPVEKPPIHGNSHRFNCDRRRCRRIAAPRRHRAPRRIKRLQNERKKSMQKPFVIAAFAAAALFAALAPAAAKTGGVGWQGAVTVNIPTGSTDQFLHYACPGKLV